MSGADERSGGVAAVLAHWLVILGGLGTTLHQPVLPRETHKGDLIQVCPRLTGFISFPCTKGYCAAVPVCPEPEPCQGGLHSSQLPEDASHGPDDHARHDQPSTVPR